MAPKTAVPANIEQRLATLGLVRLEASRVAARHLGTDAIDIVLVGFRNILVHDYARLDPAIVLRVLHTDLVDVERFRDAVLQVI